MSELVIGLVVIMLFVCVVALVLGLTTSSQRQRIEQRVEQLQQTRPAFDPSQSVVSRQLQRPFYERAIEPFVKGVGRTAMNLAPQGMIENVRKALNAAGNPGTLTEPVFLLIRGVCILIGVAVGFVLYTRVLASAAPILHMTVPLFAVFFVGMMPDYILQNKIKARQYIIRRALPDTLDLLVVSAEAGMGLDSAIAEVIQRKEGPLTEEFERALIEVRLGKRRREAWQDMAARVQLEELSALVAALYQAEELGVSVAKALRAHSDALRSKRSMKIREQAAVLGTKLLFPLIFCIFPALFVVIMGPGIIQMKTVFASMGGK
jgi:tight adherence protein C